MKRWMGLALLIVGIGCLFLTSGCYKERVVIQERPVYAPAPPPPPGPPPWAPAHGHRAKHRYYYYPASYVYFDVERRVYFYYRDAGWQVSVSLPVGIHIDAGDHVVLEMETDKPYQYHTEVAKHYPPGQAKKEGHGKGKGKKD